VAELTRVTIDDISPWEQGFRLHLTVSPEKKQKFTIQFPMGEPVSFFLLMSRFKASVEVMKALAVGDRVIVNDSDEKVTAVSPKWSTDPFECVAIGARHISPWDIQGRNGTRVYVHEFTIMFVKVTGEFGSLLKELIASPENEPLVYVPDSDFFPDVAERVSLPMSLTMIRERWENAWYRSFAAATFDVQQLSVIAEALYAPRSPIRDIAAKVVRILVAALERTAKTVKDRREEALKAQPK
jgi:hypothetical protein